jgi:CRISPR-associated protein Cmr4
MFEHNAYLIETLTNTHVGSGDTTFGIVDKQIQKDPTTSLPVFHPSSIKGAVKDHFEQFVDGNSQPKGSDMVKKFTFEAIFGGEEVERLDQIKTETEDDEKAKQILKKAPQHGLMKFYEGRLLTLPLRSSTRVYQNATSASAVLDYLDCLVRFGALNENGNDEVQKLIGFFQEIRQALNENTTVDFIVFDTGKDTAVPIVEEYENGKVIPISTDVIPSVAPYLSPRPLDEDFIPSLAVFQDAVFQQVCEAGLPVIARNSLDEKGISKNLFYEEVLPRRSVLWFMTGNYHLFSEKSEDSFTKMFEFFENKLVTDNIQMGANASIGYGVTSISRIGGKRHE